MRAVELWAADASQFMFVQGALARFEDACGSGHPSLRPRAEKRSAIVQRGVARFAGQPRHRKLTQPVAEIAERSEPIGVVEWGTMIVGKLPEDLKGSLSTVEEIEAEPRGTESGRARVR